VYVGRSKGYKNKRTLVSAFFFVWFPFELEVLFAERSISTVAILAQGNTSG